MEDYTNERTSPQTFGYLHDMSLDVRHTPTYFSEHMSQHLLYGSLPLAPVHTSAHSIDMSTYTHDQQQHLPHNFASARSSTSSSVRLSNNSVFSEQHWRGSVASTSTNCSTLSGSSREHHLSQAQRQLNSNSSGPTNQGVQFQKLKQPTPQSANQTNEQFSTCVSRRKRSRRSLKEPRYWCTSCKEGFREKYDWKRHEETYQERFETYQCELCVNKTYFLDKDFVHHHRESHRCQTCSEKKHVEAARRRRPTRTGWGCGFCLRFDSDWTDRCNHIAWHYEKAGHTITNWSQTQVILSLLQQPLLQDAWYRLLQSKQEENPSFGWSQRWAGRAEGYPDSDRPPQLQDVLEFFSPGQNAAALVAKAYGMGHQTRTCPGHSVPAQKRKPVGQSSSARKDLPPPPPPPVPPKDPGVAQPLFDDFLPWDNLISTIPEDMYLPDADPMLFRDFYPNEVGTGADMNVHGL